MAAPYSDGQPGSWFRFLRGCEILVPVHKTEKVTATRNLLTGGGEGGVGGSRGRVLLSRLDLQLLCKVTTIAVKG